MTIKIKKQYYEDNKDKIAAYKKQYHECNRDKILAYRKEKITCVCGSCVQRNEKSKHERSKKHIAFISKNNQ